MLFELYQSLQIPNITRVKNFLQELVIISSHNRLCLLSNQCFTDFIGAGWWVFLSIFRNHVYIFHSRLHSRVCFGMTWLSWHSGRHTHCVGPSFPTYTTKANITHRSFLFSLNLNLKSNAHITLALSVFCVHLLHAFLEHFWINQFSICYLWCPENILSRVA